MGVRRVGAGRRQLIRIAAQPRLPVPAAADVALRAEVPSRLQEPRLELVPDSAGGPIAPAQRAPSDGDQRLRPAAWRPHRDPLERAHPAIHYSRPSNDPLAALLQSSKAISRLKSDGPSGHLRSILDALDIPVSSQIMVFSQGSVQSRLIRANNPRALYFNDSAVVGWVRGGFIEIAAQDPEQGTVFYTVNTNWLGTPSIARSDDCLSCHHSNRTNGVPGMIEPMGHRLPLQQAGVLLLQLGILLAQPAEIPHAVDGLREQ